MKIEELKPKFVDEMPREKEDGILYISEKFGLAIHLCACGCGEQTVTPTREWKLTNNEGKITLRPSIGNFRGEHPYHAHYYVTENRIEWL